MTRKLADRIGRASRDLPMASAETAPAERAVAEACPGRGKAAVVANETASEAELDLLEAVQALDALDRQRAR
ncbi:MAG: hypothetical protein F4Z89_11665 [Acidimicrobiaceae bacterium]|nr:hypothetical protein [Acidimicrobiaceae bacterium]